MLFLRLSKQTFWADCFYVDVCVYGKCKNPGPRTPRYLTLHLFVFSENKVPSKKEGNHFDRKMMCHDMGRSFRISPIVMLTAASLFQNCSTPMFLLVALIWGSSDCRQSIVFVHVPKYLLLLSI